MAPAVLRQVRDAGRQRLAGRGDPERPAAQQHLARVGGVQPEEDARELGAARSDEAGEAEDLARAQLEADSADAGRPAAELAQLEHDVAARDHALREHGRELAPHHELDQLLAAHAGHVAGVDGGAVAHHGHAVGDRRQLLEAVRDVDHPDALVPQPAEDAEEVERVVLRERGRRLVEDQHARVGPERARDLHELLLGHAERARLALRIDPGTRESEQLPGAAPSPGPVDAPPGASGLEAERDVLGDGQVREERRLLVDGGDPERAGDAWRVVGDRSSAQKQLSGVGLHGAGHDLHERRLARAVLADERVDLAAAKLEGGGAQRVDAGVGLLHAPGREQDLRHAR